MRNFNKPSHSLAMFASAALMICFTICFACPLSVWAKDSSIDFNSVDFRSIDLSGNWQFKPAVINSVSPETTPDAAPAWTTIQVPDNWYRQGRDISGYAWYRKQFDAAPALIEQQLRLVFKGVDYTADVWLNGQYLGHHEGYFQSFDFDVAGHVRPGNNELLVLVNSPLEKPEDWTQHKRILKGIFSHHDTRPGGAWSARGQEQNTGGIWVPVYLQASQGIAVRSLSITPQKQQDKRWTIQVAAALATSIKASKLADNSQVQVEATLLPENFSGKSQEFRQQATVVAGENTLNLDFSTISPQLWWPVGHGQPNLYRVKLKFSQGGRVLGQGQSVFGFREIGVDEATQQWLVNGRRLFVRGTNYISTQWLAEMTPKRYQRDIDMMKAANINAIRVHAHIEAPAFYEACDRNGMLILQDYMLQWGYRDDEAFIQEARRQAIDMVNSLNNHPSIAVWSLHNEPPWDAPWMRLKYPDYNPEQNQVLDELLYQDVAKLDTKRIVKKVSPTKEHVWIGWYFGQWQDFAGPAPAPWITEFGAQALPNLAGLNKIFKPDELWPNSEQTWQKWEYHNFQPHETFDLARVPQGQTIEAFIANTQAYQAKLTQFAVESYRRQRYAPVTALFQFMFNEDWPSINWGVVDYWREPKPGYFALKTAYQPILPSIEWNRESYQAGETASVGLWAINDLWQDINGAQYKVVVLRDGKPLSNQQANKTIKLDIAADSARKLEQFSIEKLQPGNYQIKVSLLAANGRVLGQNQHLFTVSF